MRSVCTIHLINRVYSKAGRKTQAGSSTSVLSSTMTWIRRGQSACESPTNKRILTGTPAVPASSWTLSTSRYSGACPICAARRSLRQTRVRPRREMILSVRTKCFPPLSDPVPSERSSPYSRASACPQHLAPRSEAIWQRATNPSADWISRRSQWRARGIRSTIPRRQALVRRPRGRKD